jgi:hypothetical protein
MLGVFSSITVDRPSYVEEAGQLFTLGYVVIPVFTAQQMKEVNAAFDQTLATMPEFLPNAKQYSKTGFGALGTASSFHNKFVRDLRLYMFNELVPLFKAYDALFPGAPRNFHELLDRMCKRLRTQSPTAEAWHQDKSPPVEGDDILGGWLSILGDQFHCVPGTQNIVTDNGNGFALLKEGTELFARCNRDGCTIHVPAGSILIFDQGLIHAVKASKGYEVKRVYLKWRLTYSESDLLSIRSKNKNSRQDGQGDPQDIFMVLANQAVPKIASNQLPSMYNVRGADDPAMHEGLNKWISENIQPYLLREDHPDKFSKKRGADGNFLPKYPYPLIPLHCPSLHEQGRKYPEYTQPEIDILIPRPLSLL